MSSVIPPESVVGSILKGFLNFSASPTVLGVVVWVGYLVVVGALFVRRVRHRAPAKDLSRQPSRV